MDYLPRVDDVVMFVLSFSLTVQQSRMRSQKVLLVAKHYAPKQPIMFAAHVDMTGYLQSRKVKYSQVNAFIHFLKRFTYRVKELTVAFQNPL